MTRRGFVAGLLALFGVGTAKPEIPVVKYKPLHESVIDGAVYRAGYRGPIRMKSRLVECDFKWWIVWPDGKDSCR